ncbi:inverse autotransporter beta domain-containing protein [Enterobacter bugandensis]|uniref:inverse autotransporter beta domain-containing protein n=3 Tax=Enterobacter TaxID=547 RepID=UPI001C992504|nr:inverse autotransporter beta domain-containing protein [Enterobacter bugandensis]MBY6300157.1 inverse autotransporter beta domain-containing protein [Enterobacter bugandensis]MCM7429872.1 inverse autotransporter beta domain-containing protein [Enterobacter bugandensis]
MAGMWGSAQQNGAGDALRGAANSEVNAALTQEVEAWLNNIGGKARVTADVGIGGSDSRDFGLDYLWPVKIWQHDILFTQMSAHRWNERDILNVGLGWRHTFNPHLMAGGNLFFDQDVTRHHNRMGAGAELWSDGIRASANYYLPLSGWRHSDDSMFNDDPDRYELYERAARGWDLNLETALSQHVALKLGWFQWYGDKVDVNGSRSEASHNPHGLNLGLKWQPVPLVGVSAEQSMISGQRDNFSVGLNFHWEFGRKLSEMLASENAAALSSLMQSRTEFVTRNNNIVLAYKQEEKDRRLYFSPTEKTTQAGVPLLHAVKGGQGGVIRYTSSSTAIATVEPGSGLVNPTHRGDVTITATETSPVDPEHVLSSASYHLTVTPGDFAPSVEGVAIKGDMSPGQILEGSYLYKSNEGEDEDPEKTRLRWYDADSGELLKEGSATYEVQTRDMARSVVFEVTPFNKKGIPGESGTAKITGSATITTLRIDHLLSPGEIRRDGSVKFFEESHGALLVLAEVKDGQGSPLTDQMVYWQSRNSLGSLSQNSVRTDEHGQALVKIENIMADGEDEITASLIPPGGIQTQSTASDNNVQQEKMALVVDFAHPLAIRFVASPERAEVATEKTFTIEVTDQDGKPLTVEKNVTWSSDGETLSGKTDSEGRASIALIAPQKAAEKWVVNATVDTVSSPSAPVSLEPGPVAKVVLDVPENVVAGSEDKAVSAQLYDRFDNAVISRKQAITWRIEGSQFREAPTGDSDEHGIASATIVVPEKAPSQVKVSAGDEQKIVNVTVGKVNHVELKGTPDTLNANGSSTSTLTAIALDEHNNSVPDAPVTWSLITQQFGALSNAIEKTDAEGKATATFTTASAGGNAQIEVDIGGKKQATQLTLNGYPIIRSITLNQTAGLKVGDTVSVEKVDVEQNGGGEVTLSYQWHRDGGAIDAATSDSYHLTEQDTGATLFVVVTATNEAKNEGDKASLKTEPVVGKASDVTVTASADSVDANGLNTITYTATAKDRFGRAVVGEAIVWDIDKPELVSRGEASAVTGTEGTGTMIVTAKNTGGNITVSATVNGKKGESGVALQGIPTIKSITLNQTAGLKVGDTVSVEKVDVEQNGGGEVKLSYQWHRDGGAIDGATSDSYHLTEQDTGATLFVAVTATNAAKNEGYKASSKTEPVTGKASAVTVTASAASVEANGLNTITYTATVKDRFGRAVVGEAIVWDIDKPELVARGETSTITGTGGVGTMTVTTKNTGGTITVSATVNGKKGESGVEIYGAPLVTDLHISGTPKVGQTLSAEYTFSANGSGADASTYQWQWKDGETWKNAAAAGNTARTFTLPDSYAGYSVRVVVTPKGSSHPSLTGTLQESQAVTAYGTPAVEDVRTSGTPEVGQTLRAEYTFKANGTGADASTYIWARYEKTSWMPIEGANGREYTLQAGDAGYSIKVTIIPEGSSQPSLVGAVQHSPALDVYGAPSVADLHISGTPEVGQTLRAEYTFTANGSGADASTYIWARYERTSWMPIEGATGREYTLQAGDAGYSIKAVVTPTGSSQPALAGAVQSSPSVDAYGAPSVTNLHISGTPRVGQTLNAEYTLTANGSGADASTYQWQWKDGETWKNAAAAGNTARTFTLPDSYAGYSVRVVVTPKGSSHPALAGVAQESSAVEVYGAPSVSGLKISGTPKVGQTLRAEYTFKANGTGADASTYIWARYEKTSWMPIEGANGREYTLQAGDAGYSIKAVVTPTGSSQPALAGAVQSSPSVDAYGAPSVTNLHISGTPKVGQTLRAEYTFTSNGSGTDKSTFIWGRYEKTSWMPIEGATGREYTLQAGDAGYSIKVTVIPEGSSQPQLQGDTQHSPAVDAYGAPSITNLHISGTPKVGQTLSAEYTFTANGSGTDASSFQWQWQDGATWKNAAGGTARTFTLPDSYAGYSVRVVVTPKGSSQPSLTGAVQDSPTMAAYDAPSVTGLRISGTPKVGQTLRAEYTFTANGAGTDISSFQWQWQDGAAWKNAAGGTASSFTLPDSYAGYNVRVMVTPKGSSQPSLTGAVQNSPAVAVYGMPSVTGLRISGMPEVGQTLRAEYTFTANGAGTDVSSFQWQWKDGQTWRNVAGGTAKTFTLPDSYAGYDVRVAVTPKGSGQPLSGTQAFSGAVTIRSKPAPFVTNLGYSGSTGACNRITATYTYNANGGASEGNTIFQWKWGSTVVSNIKSVTLGYWGEVTLYVTPVNKDGIRGKTESKTFKNTGLSSCDW